MLDAMATSQPRRVSLSHPFFGPDPARSGPTVPPLVEASSKLGGGWSSPELRQLSFAQILCSMSYTVLTLLSRGHVMKARDQKAPSCGISCHLSLDAFSGDTASRRAAAVTARNWLL